MNTRKQGTAGEKQAADYLKDKGHRILAHNFKTAYGEIDIISMIQHTLVFTEVKQRSYRAFGGCKHNQTKTYSPDRCQFYKNKSRA